MNNSIDITLYRTAKIFMNQLYPYVLTGNIIGLINNHEIHKYFSEVLALANISEYYDQFKIDFLLYSLVSILEFDIETTLTKKEIFDIVYNFYFNKDVECMEIFNIIKSYTNEEYGQELYDQYQEEILVEI